MLVDKTFMNEVRQLMGHGENINNIFCNIEHTINYDIVHVRVI